MIAAWMVYAALVGLALGAAALLAERALRALGRPSRAVWAAAMAGSALVPAWTLAGPLRRSGDAAGGEGLAIEIGPVAAATTDSGAAVPAGFEGVASAAVAALAPLDGPVLVLWGVAAALLAGSLLVSFVRLGRERRGWSRVSLDGDGVYVSDAYGPAVFGFLRPGVVVPRWFLSLSPEARRLALLHEREHARAGDARLTLAALLLAAALPWNPALWWQIKRLRLAVEVDCDRRVLARGVRARTYGRLLLAVAGSGGRRWMATPALVEGAGELERRIEMLSERRPNRPALRAGLAFVAAAGLVALACEAPGPPEPREDAPAAESASEPRAPSLDPDAMERPSFIPYDTPPRLRNVPEVQLALLETYPDDLREAGVEGRVELWMLVDEAGRVATVQLKTSSEVEALDRAALEVARIMAFEPAENRGVPTPVWVTQWISFTLPPEGAGQAAVSAPGARGDASDVRKDMMPGLEDDARSIAGTAPETRPLVFVDGERRLAGLEGLDPSTIRHIEVIRGEQALARFGEEGRGGAVLITTES